MSEELRFKGKRPDHDQNELVESVILDTGWSREQAETAVQSVLENLMDLVAEGWLKSDLIGTMKTYRTRRRFYNINTEDYDVSIKDEIFFTPSDRFMGKVKAYHDKVAEEAEKSSD